MGMQIDWRWRVYPLWKAGTPCEVEVAAVRIDAPLEVAIVDAWGFRASNGPARHSSGFGTGIGSEAGCECIGVKTYGRKTQKSSHQ